MEDKWIRFADEADYNLSEIMRDHNCSLEEAEEIAEEWFSEREPRKTIYNDGNILASRKTIYSEANILDTEYDILDTERKPEELTVPFKPEEVMDFNKEYSMEKIVSLIDRLKEMKSQNNIESIFIDKDSSVTIKF